MATTNTSGKSVLFSVRPRWPTSLVVRRPPGTGEFAWGAFSRFVMPWPALNMNHRY